jgi:nucleoside-specific outer membrane channel protein Tsx
MKKIFLAVALIAATAAAAMAHNFANAYIQVCQ